MNCTWLRRINDLLGGANCGISVVFLLQLSLQNGCTCDNNGDLKHMKRGHRHTTGRGEKRTEKNKPRDFSLSKYHLFITRGQRGNAACRMFSFAHLCRSMVRFGVRRAQTPGVSTFSLPTQKRQLPFPIHPPAILFYFFTTHLSNHKGLLSSAEPGSKEAPPLAPRGRRQSRTECRKPRPPTVALSQQETERKPATTTA